LGPIEADWIAVAGQYPLILIGWQWYDEVA
jgi:hypothetical protein